MAAATHHQFESVKVLHTSVSKFGLRVIVALKEKGVKYEYHEQDLSNKSHLLLESNPIHKKVPVLLHNGKPICESLIILEYIDEVWPSHDKAFLPRDPYQRARARFWADYVDKKVSDAGSRIICCPEGEQREQGKEDFIECLVTLDGALRELSGGAGPYFGGQHIGFVDIALAPFLCWFGAYETLGAFKPLDEAKCAHLSKWAKTIVECPSVKEAFSMAPTHKVLEVAQMMRKNALAA